VGRPGGGQRLAAGDGRAEVGVRGEGIGDERGELCDPQTVLGDRFGIPDSQMPPASAPYPLEHPELESELCDDCVLLVWVLHDRDPPYRYARRTA